MVCARPLSRRLRHLTLAAASFALPASASSTAYAGDGRVLVIDVDPRVVDALVVALSPWSLTIVRAPGPNPASDIHAAAARARVLASDLHAGAVVWIAPPHPPDDEATLWVYDAQTLDLAVRPLTVWAPFDDAGAAAVALSVKTVLRASPLIAPESSDAPARPVDRPAPPPPIVATAPTASHAAWRFEALVGARAPTGAGAAVEPRAALGASVWPVRFGGHAGLGLDLHAGPGVSIATGSFQGDLREGSLDATARLRAPVASSLALELQGGLGVVLTSLDGRAIPDGPPLHALRLDPAIDLGAIADVTLGPRTSLGVFAVGSAFLRFQRYSLDGAPLLGGPAVIVLSGLRLSVEVD